MRQIKFRGIDTVTGKYVYGAYLPFLDEESMPMIATPDGLVEVKVGSVQQLIARDINDREVYEGDIVKRVKEWSEEAGAYVKVEAMPMDAAMSDINAIEDGEIIFVRSACRWLRP